MLVTTHCRVVHVGGYGFKEHVATLPVVLADQNSSGIVAVYCVAFDSWVGDKGDSQLTFVTNGTVGLVDNDSVIWSTRFPSRRPMR